MKDEEIRKIIDKDFPIAWLIMEKALNEVGKPEKLPILYKKIYKGKNPKKLSEEELNSMLIDHFFPNLNTEEKKDYLKELKKETDTSNDFEEIDFPELDFDFLEK